ncbi:MAG: hypothetical protein ACKOQ0_02060 [Solirubrobacterales bacterium]
MSEEPAIETVASVGVLDPAVVTLREFLHHSTAARAIAVVEREPGLGPAVIDCGRFEAIEVELGDRTVRLPHDAPLDAVAPPLPEVKPIPPVEVDPQTGEVAGTIGGLEHLVDAVGSLADALGAGSVAMAVFATTDPANPLSVSCRAGGSEPPVVAIGDEPFELPPPPAAAA